MRSMTYKFPAASFPAAHTPPATQRTVSISTDGSEGKSKGAREQDRMRDRRRNRLAELNALLPPPYRQDSHQPDMRAIDGAIDYLRVVQATIDELQREVGALNAQCRSAQAANEHLVYEKTAMAGTIAQMQAQAMSQEA
ncbi:hypothetical protein EWM64_g344 [Hericium alpestre]|uniref:BHLH domain-containing protein n=1 Tax=Hericium alpestre TaxID=135208 RepID=A0A4Z0AC73_9AGAM|nr:hypothetical protein EWM64_g344 [Hericium alpestre]